MADLTSATTEMNRQVQSTWYNSIVPYIGASSDPVELRLLYTLRTGNERPTADDGTEFQGIWARVTTRHAAPLSSSIGGKRTQNTGTMYVNIFVPLATTDAGAKTLAIAKFLTDALKAHKGDVQFQRVYPREGVQDGPWSLITVIATFVWSEFRS